jgi:hypothetical protein
VSQCASYPRAGRVVLPAINELRSSARWLFLAPINGPRAILLVRLLAGGVFLSVGILKFVYKNQGVGRFTKLALPLPEVAANFIGRVPFVLPMLSTTRNYESPAPA